MTPDQERAIASVSRETAIVRTCNAWLMGEIEVDAVKAKYESERSSAYRLLSRHPELFGGAGDGE